MPHGLSRAWILLALLGAVIAAQLVPAAIDCLAYFGQRLIPFPSPFHGQALTHRTWVQAVERGDVLSVALAYGMPGSGQLGEAPALVAEMQALRLTGLSDGRYLGRFRGMRSFSPGGTWVSQSATGLSRWEFDLGSLCYAAHLYNDGSVWRVLAWSRVSPEQCEEAQAFGL